jgi:hypothetical protein
MIPQYYFSSINREMPLSAETPILPLENNDEIFDRRQQSTGTTPPNIPGGGNTTVPNDMDLYTQGYLQRQIGKRVRIQFLIGSNALQDRTGVLTQVGISYVIIRDQDTNNLVLGDMYAIKFVDVY